MSESLADAFNRAKGELKPQLQGTCGLYCFWYATMLLRQLDASKTLIAYPRKVYMRDANVTPSAENISSRQFAKTLGSGQGEILSGHEMESVIRKYEYHSVRYEVRPNADGYIDNQETEQFISSSLEKRHPVLFPYMAQEKGYRPLNYITADLKGGIDYGAHWCLIIQEAGGAYGCILPSDPNKKTYFSKQAMIQSNSIADDYNYERYWQKKPFGEFTNVKPEYPSRDPATNKTSYYDLGEPARQKLANILIAIS